MKDLLFIETLKIIDGHFVCPLHHLQRMRDTQTEAFGRVHIPLLTDDLIPEDKRQGIVKCRITYGETIGRIEYEPYRARNIRSLKLVDGGNIDYHLKYADRSLFHPLLEQRGTCDDILIVREGEITDTSYSNVVFFDGAEYITPRAFLLNGTKRQKLLREGKVKVQTLRVEDLPRFDCLYLINAMLDIKDNAVIKVRDIR